VYLGFILAVGIPVMMSELIIGRSARRNAFGAFKSLAPGTPWRFIGLLGVAAAFMILSFYGVVAGWSLEYIVVAIQNGFSNKSPEEIGALFNTLIQSPVKPVVWQLIFMALTAAIVIVGVQKGIEKYTKILMPLLVVILIFLCVKSVTLNGAKAGLEFLFKPDFSKLTSEAVLSALGHAFFTLSLGMGTLITYGSYIKKDNNLLSTALNVTIADTVIALLAGVAIFPAVFAFGIEPSQGPGLIFVTLPNVFHQMPGGFLVSILFFVLLSVAALTSSISILEVVVAYLKEEFKLKRNFSTVLATVLISIIGVFCSLSMGGLSSFTIFGLNLFDLMDWISANLLLPIGGLFIALFIGWFLGIKKVYRQILLGGKRTHKRALLYVFIYLVKFVAPIAIAVVLLNKIGLLRF
jgi:NSS family neurotransmitter:Na+ symporter